VTATVSGRVTSVRAAHPAAAASHFARRLEYETDCSDVHHDLAAGAADFVVVDARSHDDHAAGHVPGAVSLPHRAIDEHVCDALDRDTLVVTYCWGPHCNAATQAAARLAALGFRVKEMLGGYEAWCAEGHPVERGRAGAGA
jgi:rhodanese-related sulfurtransferase